MDERTGQLEPPIHDRPGERQGGPQITKGDWVVRRVLKVDEDNQVIYFTTSGVNPKEDPYHVHYYKINMDGKQMTCLTPEEGNHSGRLQ